MGESVCDTIETILATVQDEVEDPEPSYQLRTARQLIMICKDQNETFKETLSEADLDQDIVDDLRRLGYLD